MYSTAQSAAGPLFLLSLAAACAAVVLAPDGGLSVALLPALLVGWTALCIARPERAFIGLLFVVVLLSPRLVLSALSVQGRGNRGQIMLGDLLWAALLLGMAARWSLHPRLPPIPARVASHWLMLLPYVLLAFLLPLLGVAVGGWPLSFAVPGLRQLQWVSYALIAYVLGRRYGIAGLVQGVVRAVFLAGLVHAAYSAVQLGFFLRLLGRGWVYWDDVVQGMAVDSWFYYPRATGLLVSPNSYGLFSAMLFTTCVAVYVARLPVPRWLWAATVASSLFGIGVSGSRSAIIGLLVATACWVATAAVRRRVFGRGASLALGVAGSLALAVTLIGPLMPVSLSERFRRLRDVASEGVEADANASGRTEMWARAWDMSAVRYPAGTWVPASLAMDMPLDSYYVSSAIQGTPFFTFAFGIFVVGGLFTGLRLVRTLEEPQQAALGLMLIGWFGIVAGSSFTLSPMLQMQVVCPLWALVGMSAGSRLTSSREAAPGA